MFIVPHIKKYEKSYLSVFRAFIQFYNPSQTASMKKVMQKILICMPKKEESSKQKIPSIINSEVHDRVFLTVVNQIGQQIKKPHLKINFKQKSHRDSNFKYADIDRFLYHEVESFEVKIRKSDEKSFHQLSLLECLEEMSLKIIEVYLRESKKSREIRIFFSEYTERNEQLWQVIYQEIMECIRSVFPEVNESKSEAILHVYFHCKKNFIIKANFFEELLLSLFDGEKQIINKVEKKKMEQEEPQLSPVIKKNNSNVLTFAVKKELRH